MLDNTDELVKLVESMLPSVKQKGDIPKSKSVNSCQLLTNSNFFTQITDVFYYDKKNNNKKTDATQMHFNSVVSGVWTPHYMYKVL